MGAFIRNLCRIWKWEGKMKKPFGVKVKVLGCYSSHEHEELSYELNTFFSSPFSFLSFWASWCWSWFLVGEHHHRIFLIRSLNFKPWTFCPFWIGNVCLANKTFILFNTQTQHHWLHFQKRFLFNATTVQAQCFFKQTSVQKEEKKKKNQSGRKERKRENGEGKVKTSLSGRVKSFYSLRFQSTRQWKWREGGGKWEKKKERACISPRVLFPPLFFALSFFTLSYFLSHSKIFASHTKTEFESNPMQLVGRTQLKETTRQHPAAAATAASAATTEAECESGNKKEQEQEKAKKARTTSPAAVAVVANAMVQCSLQRCQFNSPPPFILLSPPWYFPSCSFYFAVGAQHWLTLWTCAQWKCLCVWMQPKCTERERAQEK